MQVACCVNWQKPLLLARSGGCCGIGANDRARIAWLRVADFFARIARTAWNCVATVINTNTVADFFDAVITPARLIVKRFGTARFACIPTASKAVFADCNIVNTFAIFARI